MNGKTREIDIAKNLKIIEWLKAEMVDSVGKLFKTLLKSRNDDREDGLATIIIITYLLSKKVGVNFSSLDKRIIDKLNVSINKAHETEQWQEDLSVLSKYLESKKR